VPTDEAGCTGDKNPSHVVVSVRVAALSIKLGCFFQVIVVGPLTSSSDF
jgi:hypothetical protein